MPFLGKSGTSRISCFKCSQVAFTFTDALSAITTLLRCEMYLDPQPASFLIPQHYQPARPSALAAIASEAQAVDRASQRQALPRCHRGCCAPSRRFLACAPRAPQTTGNRRLARALERRNGELRFHSGEVLLVCSPFSCPTPLFRSPDDPITRFFLSRSRQINALGGIHFDRLAFVDKG